MFVTSNPINLAEMNFNSTIRTDCVKIIFYTIVFMLLRKKYMFLIKANTVILSVKKDQQ